MIELTSHYNRIYLTVDAEITVTTQIPIIKFLEGISKDYLDGKRFYYLMAAARYKSGDKKDKVLVPNTFPCGGRATIEEINTGIFFPLDKKTGKPDRIM